MLVRAIDIHDPGMQAAILALQRKAFGHFPESWMRHILLDSHSATVMIGVFEQDSLKAVNGFVAHDLHRNGISAIAYQSCMSATDPAFSGRGAFSAIINYAKSYLKDNGGAFIFGYPNANSGPIFTGKLGFDETPLATAYFLFCANIPVPFFSLDGKKLAGALHASSCAEFDARKTAAWKRSRKDKDEILESEFYTNYLFGRVVEKRLGPLRLRMLTVGGFEINKPRLFAALLQRTAARHGARLVRIIAPAHSPIIRAAQFARVTGRTEPLITFPLNWDITAQQVNVWPGLKDVY